MMSLKGDGKPVSFIEDCAVPLEHLAEYTDALTEVFARHGTHGTWYAHASVGTLHVRPILDMRRDGPKGGAGKMRAIAEEAAALVRKFRGRIQRRARRRAMPRRMDRMAVRTIPLRSFSRDQQRTRPNRIIQSRQDHRSAENGRCRTVSLCAAFGSRDHIEPSRSSRCSIGRRGTCKTIR